MNLEKPNSNNKPPSLDQQESIKVAWEKMLSKFPSILQTEIRDERPNPDQDDLELFGRYHLVEPDYIYISLKKLLDDEELLGKESTILRTPPDVIEKINKNWGTHFDTSPRELHDTRPGRFHEYSLRPGNTAEPSLLCDGRIEFGVGRFIAALLRGDTNLRVWNLSSK